MVDIKRLKQTASQTAGPYVHIGLTPRAVAIETYEQDLGWNVVNPQAEDRPIVIEGVIWDAEDLPVKDALLEFWQADSAGQFGTTQSGFQGWRRVVTDFETGLWSFETIKPGLVQVKAGECHAPHLNLWLVARGINIGLNTRIYFPDEVSANMNDPILSSIDDPKRKNTLVASKEESGERTTYRFDIHLSGARETVFFDL